MRTLILIIATMILWVHRNTTCAQSVGIGTVNPDPSAKLDIMSTDQGVLFPRMTRMQRLSIAAPGQGLLVYETDSIPGYWYNQGTSVAPNWVRLRDSQTSTASAGKVEVYPLTGIGGTVPYTGGGYVFYGTPVTLTFTETKRVSGCGIVGFSLNSGPQYSDAFPLSVDLIYQPAGASAAIPFNTIYPITVPVHKNGAPVTVAASIVLSPGTYTIGYGVANFYVPGPGIFNNSNMAGWLMVTDP